MDLERDLEKKAKELQKKAIEAAAAGEAAVEAAIESKGKELEKAARDLAVKGLERGIEVADPGRYAPPGPEDERLTVTTYIFGEKDEFWNDLRAAGVSRKRFLGFTTLAVSIALVGNLFGVTSALLSLSPEAARKSKLDVLFPVKGFKRVLDAEDGYELTIPKAWVADTALALAEQRERARMLDPPSVEEVRRRKANAAKLRPDAAFGPPGGTEAENVSVVKSSLVPGFTLRGTLGDPATAAEKLLSTAIAPEGSGKTWELIEASEHVRGASLVYQFEFRVKLPSGKLFHNICSITNRGATLYTLTVLSLEESWAKQGQMYTQIAESFMLTR